MQTPVSVVSLAGLWVDGALAQISAAKNMMNELMYCVC